MGDLTGKIVDIHCHVGLLGDQWPQWGRLGPRFVGNPAYRVFLLYARVPPHAVTDAEILDATVKILSETQVDHVVCLALDHVHDEHGRPQPERTAMFVANDYVLELRRRVGSKVLLGASVHPYATDFEDRVKRVVDEGAVLLKWLPSAQDIDLASPKAAAALKALARLGPKGRALPLLLHTGAEYAIPPAGDDTPSLDFHSWSPWDAFWNRLRGSRRWRTPDVTRVAANLRDAVAQGAVIILAHCGLPYFAPKGLGWAEHSDLDAVRQYLTAIASVGSDLGRFYGDVSACCTPFRKGFFDDLKALPPECLVFGSDFPTPIFELSADLAEAWRDFKAVLAGDWSRVVVPQDNLLDVNLREVRHAFGAEHPLFTNFGRLWDHLNRP